jgi:hypothetical protein
MDPSVDPFKEPPQNLREYLGEELANALDAAANAGETLAQFQHALTHRAELYKGPMDGQAVVVAYGSEFATFEGHPYHFSPSLTVARGREIWVYLNVPTVKG